MGDAMPAVQDLYLEGQAGGRVCLPVLRLEIEWVDPDAFLMNC